MSGEAALIGKYAAYSEYKDSRFTWLGKIPNHWSVSPIKWQIESVDGGAWGEEPGGLEDAIVLRSTEQTADGQWKIDDPAPRKLSAHEAATTLLKKDDLLMTKSSGSSLHIGKTSIVTEEVASLRCGYSNFMQRIRIKSGYSAKFYWYIFNNELARKQLDYLSNSTTGLANLNATMIGGVVGATAPKVEQEKIANFLDYETAKIDTLIEKQQQLIKLLKEKRQAVISHAVTKGLPSPTGRNTPMRNSGVEWLGNVPEHWGVRAVSKLSQKITNGYVGPTRDILVPEGVPYVQATHIKRGKVNFDDAYFVRQPWSDVHAKSILVKGDVLIVQTGAGTGDVGLVTEKEEGFNCHALIIVQPKKDVITGDYLSMVFQSQYGYSVLYSIRTGGMHPHLNCGEVQFVKIPVPPKEEQTQITEYIANQINKIETLVERQLRMIELMQERRTALISAAVTGKIDVRNWQAPESTNTTNNNRKGAAA